MRTWRYEPAGGTQSHGAGDEPAAGTRRFDAVVVGGGPAGLSAALVLGRARRRVLVVDAGRPANAAATGVRGLLGHPGDAPASVLRAAGAAQLRELGTVTVVAGTVADARPEHGGGFAVEIEPLAAGSASTSSPQRERSRRASGPIAVASARALLLAGGLRYVPPPLPGLKPLWGRAVHHCQFCDGWEVRDRLLAVHADGATAVRRGLLLRGWSERVLVVGRLSVADRAELVAAGVRVRGERIVRLEGDAGDPGQLRAIRFADGSVEPCDALFVAPRLARPDMLAERLGCAARPDAPALLVNEGGRTTVPGVWAAGDLADPERSVANAVASGSRVGRAMALELLRPVGAAPAVPSPAATRSERPLATMR
jgi:thioredoxin reductase